MTNLTKPQQSLAQAFKAAGMDFETAMTVLSGLETRRQQFLMTDWLAGVYDRTGAFPKEAAICRALATIRELSPGQTATASDTP